MAACECTFFLWLKHVLRVGDGNSASELFLANILWKTRIHLKNVTSWRKRLMFSGTNEKYAILWEQSPSSTCLHTICSQIIQKSWHLLSNRKEKKWHLYKISKLLYTAFLVCLLQSFLSRQVKDLFFYFIFPCVSLYLYVCFAK